MGSERYCGKLIIDESSRDVGVDVDLVVVHRHSDTQSRDRSQGSLASVSSSVRVSHGYDPRGERPRGRIDCARAREEDERQMGSEQEGETMTATANHSEVSAVPQTDNPAQSMRATIAIAISIVALVVSGISIAGWTQASGERRRVENRLACLELPGPNGLRPRRRLDRTSVRRIGAHSREVGIVASIDQWELRGDQGAPADGSRVRLHNRVVDESLKRERRENGIDLVWDAASEAPNSTIRNGGRRPGVVRSAGRDCDRRRRLSEVFGARHRHQSRVVRRPGVSMGEPLVALRASPCRPTSRSVS